MHRARNISSGVLALAVAITLHGAASAQCDPGNGLGGTGPDVIVGELTTPNSYGNAGGYYAYSLGTTSCNIGTGELDWIASNPNHPVIAQNMYRLHDGRFEHIGMSWLKHGFTALQGNSCGCGCTSSGTGARLGVGCSDPYGAGLNGSQGSLGPRSEVIDPAHGGFLYPPILQPTNLDLTWRRLRVHGDDLDAAQYPGALYFVEGHYVTPDDAISGNAHNNASYRAVSVSTSTSNHAISYTGPTQRQLQGIQAWQDSDPSVTLINLTDGENGLFVIGYTVTPVGATGLYAYEYALYNMNSTRAARSFELPLPTGVIASDIEFHDVEYHSNEPYDGTDWPVVTAGGTIEWSTDTAVANPDANALRWGTLYNFRFVANSPPGPANLTIGLFESGIPAVLSTLIVGPTASTLDCNQNGTLDIEEIAAGAPDCDGNGLLDECQDDCDSDGAADSCEILAGTDFDCDGDLVPDSCQIAAGTIEDCDQNGVPDLCQIAQGTGTDCDQDGVLDACQLATGVLTDCDGDGLADLCEIDLGLESDCDGNGEIDSCQIAAGAGDCDANGILDVCETTGIFAFQTVLNPPPTIIDNLPPVVSTTTVGQAGLVDDIDLAVDITHTFIGDLTLDLLSPNGVTVRVHNQSGGSTDNLQVTYDDDGGAGTISPSQPLSAFDGDTAVGTWTLTVDDLLGGDQGLLHEWTLFVGISGAGIPDCNGNGIHDACEILTAGDCNGNGVLDECDIASGTSTDADGDGVPDECGGGGSQFIRGDANTDGGIDISDPVRELEYLFSAVPVSCLAALDANADGGVDLADAVSLLDGLFSGGSAPSAPYPGCGPDPVTPGLGCDVFPTCP